MQPRVLVIGSVNHDITVRTERFPLPGETLLGHDVSYGLGGKGANQAVAAARTGVATSFVAAVGDDEVGTRLLGWLAERGVDVRNVRVTPGFVTGTAHITVDETGENQIVVVPGANASMTPATIEALRDLVAAADIVVLQTELPAETVQHAVAVARDAGTRVLLNLAPYVGLRAESLADVDILVVNELEAGLLLGRTRPSVDVALAAAHELASLARSAVITLGADGAVWASDGEAAHVGARPVQVVDTTGAGDAFVGVLAASLAADAGLAQAVEDGVRAATLSVLHVGAGMGYPAFGIGNGAPRQLDVEL